ncbi:MAG: site-2 protease family protein [Actinomycetota bacterium]
MSTAVGVTAFIVMLLLVILIHEAAHFGFAKLFGFKVEEYFVGFGPKLWSTRRGETEYGIKAIPAGGYVKIAGMDPFRPVPTTDPDHSRTYYERPMWQRAVVIAAGPFTHFVIAFIFFAIALTFAGGLLPTESVTFSRVEPTLDGVSSPATDAGIEVGDRVVRVQAGDNPVLIDPSPDAFTDYVRSNQGETLHLELERNGRSLSVTADPVLAEVEGESVPRIGVVLSGTDPEPIGFPGSIVEGGRMVWTSISASVGEAGRIFGPQGIGRMYELVFTDAEREITDPASAVGLAGAAGELSQGGRFFQLLFLFGGINIFVGLLNLLPLPPFDGGHLAVLVIEKIRGKRVDVRRLVPIAAVVLTFFVLFTSAAVLVDITKPLQLGP